MDGLLLIDKPKGWTSFDAVAKVRGAIKKSTGQKRPKVGHTGTLDPLATGLLILTIGSYCKRAQEFSKLDKVYEVELTLGYISSTDDDEGDKHLVSESRPDALAVDAVVKKFVGTISQVPPIYSAIKVNGKRAYNIARSGQTVEMTPRTVTVHSIDGIIYEYPYVRFKAHVSSGTYIRSLARDIGESLGTGAFMSSLRRTAIGTFTLPDNPLPLDAITAEQIHEQLIQA